MDTLVSTDWLAGELGSDDLRIVDASWHLPDAGRDAAAEFASGHIPGAVFLDLGTLTDPDGASDNTLPPPRRFADRMGMLGIGDGCRVVFYDDSAVHSAARAWFMARLFGIGEAAILDGGLAKWRAEGRETEAGHAVPPGREFTPGSGVASLRSRQDMLANVDTGAEQVVDARGPARFRGDEPEPRPGMAAGHIPGARNVHYAALFEPDRTLKDDAGLRSAFEDAGVDLGRPVVTTCGSGITACVLAFALDRLGKRDVALYDGSWAEWGIDPATPKATGPA